MARRRRSPTWRHSAGKKGINRVTVYERKDRGVLYVEWWSASGIRNQRTLEYITGVPVPNTEEGRVLAVAIAERYSQERERDIYAELQDVYGNTPSRTVDDLLGRLHEDRGGSWSESYARDQARYRTFWGTRIGPTPLRNVRAAVVERIASDEALRREWSPRTQGAVLRYIVDAFYFAEKKLKWIEPRDNLSAVTIPSAKSRGRAYSLTEMRALLPALVDVDIRAGWIGHVCWQTGRRLSAVRTLRKKDVLHTDGRAVLRFPRETDKARAEGEAVIVGTAADLTGQLMGFPGKYVLGIAPPSLDECNDWLRNAEAHAGVTHVTGRAWHGIKRRWATETAGRRGRKGQAGTTEQTLSRVYEQDDLEPKAALAHDLEKLVR